MKVIFEVFCVEVFELLCFIYVLNYEIEWVNVIKLVYLIINLKLLWGYICYLSLKLF